MPKRPRSETARDHFSWVFSGQGSQTFVAVLLDPPELDEALKVAAARYKTTVRDTI